MIPAFIADKALRKMKGEDDDMAAQRRMPAFTPNGGFSGATMNNPNTRVGGLKDQGGSDGNHFDNSPLYAKGGSAPPPPSPMAEAQAQIALERERAMVARENEERQRALDEAARQERIGRARGIQGQAYNAALDFGNEQVTGRGFDQGLVDQYGLLDMYTSAIDRAKLGIAEDDLNPMASFNTRGAFNDALETATGAYRGDLRRGIYDRAGDGFEYNLFADTSDDAILEEILGTHRADAQAQIDMARARGQLNDVGFGRAQQQLGMQGEAAMADLQDLGLGVLTGYRDDLRGLRDNELTRIGQLGFDSPYNLDSFGNRLDTRTSDFQNRMRGDLFRATQGQSFFDPSSIISGSGAIQGFYNPTSTQKQASGINNPLLNAFTEDEQSRQQQQTARGTNGVF